MIYLDNFSSSPVRPEVFEAMQPWFTEYYGNAAALHQLGIRSKNAIATARTQIQNALHAERPEDIIFTSCGTEANNLAVKGTAFALQNKGNHIILSNAEHPSIENSVAFLEKYGFTATRVPVDHKGFISPEAIKNAITDKTILIATHYTNYDIGTIQPIAEIGEIAQQHNISFLVDATFSAGWLPIDVSALKASLLTISPHRFNGPKGVGILYKNRRNRLSSIIHGGMQENNYRSGTENVPAIVGGALALEMAMTDFDERIAKVSHLQKRLWDGLKESIPYIHLNGPTPGEHRHPCNLSISSEFIEGEAQLLLCNAAGIAVASGSSCSAKNLKSSPVLQAIGVDLALAQSNLILTLGKYNTDEDVDYVLQTFPKIIARLRSMSPLYKG